jgi:glycosyltransferase involved in cell wall biosynthesis
MRIVGRAEATMIRLSVGLGVTVARLLVRGLRLTGRWPSAEAERSSRFAVVSHVLPPTWSGQAMVLERLLAVVPTEQAVLIASAQPVAGGPTRTPIIVLASEPFEAAWCRPGWRATFGVLVRCFLRGWRVASIVNRERCAAVIACTGDLIDLPAAMIACRILGLPLVAYYFDDYVAQWSWAPAAHARAQVFEPLVLRTAHQVLVPNERLGTNVSQRSDKQPRIIRNPAWTQQLPAAAGWTGGHGAPCRIVYTGAVYHVNYAAFRCLLKSFAELGDLQPELHIYTAQASDELAQAGIQGPAVRVFGHVDPGQAWKKQREASVLFMGFSFEESVAAIVRSSAPGKLGDYLASGVPIVALAPAASFLIGYLRGQQCGEVVDRLDPQAVAVAIRKVVSDSTRRATLVQNALTCARSEFLAAAAAKEFLGAIPIHPRAVTGRFAHILEPGAS